AGSGRGGAGGAGGGVVGGHARDTAGAPFAGREVRVLRLIDGLAAALVAAALLGELSLVLANVAARSSFHRSFLWADEAARLALSILAFIGGPLAYRRGEHAFVRIVVEQTSPRIARACLALADVIVLFVAGLTGIASTGFIAASWAERTPILQLPAGLIALPLTLGMALLAVYAAANLLRRHGGTALKIAAVFAAVMLVAVLTRDDWLPLLGGDAAIVATLVLFCIAIFIGVPVGFVLLLATAAYLWAT